MKKHRKREEKKRDMAGKKTENQARERKITNQKRDAPDMNKNDKTKEVKGEEEVKRKK